MAEGTHPDSSMVEARNTAFLDLPDALAGDLAQDNTLDPYLAAHIALLAESLINQSSESRHPEGLVRAAVEAHEWCVVLAVVAEMQRTRVFNANSGILRGFRSSLGRLARVVREFAYSLSAPQRAYAADLMTHYRNSTLAFSWMPYCQGDQEFRIVDPLFPDEKENAVMEKLAEQVAREFVGVEGVSVDAVRAVVKRIASAILERGYSAFANDIAMPGLFEGLDMDARGLPINVIPGDRSGQCAPLLVAVAQAGRRAGMSKIIPQVRKHLIDCGRITNAVIIVSDEWKPGILSNSLGDLMSHVTQGKRIVFLLAPQPGNGIVHMPISLI
ncbi:MAG: hypothetical protein WCH40_04090 [Verrucomicrobiales bacterium]